MCYTTDLWFGLISDSGSARFNAEQLARTVQARIEANRTSIGATASGTTVYSREPNRKNSFFIGNLTWVCGYWDGKMGGRAPFYRETPGYAWMVMDTGRAPFYREPHLGMWVLGYRMSTFL